MNNFTTQTRTYQLVDMQMIYIADRKFTAN